MSSEKQAVIFGAGRIGRGFLGQLLWEGGWATTLVDAAPALVAALNQRGEYPLRLVSDETVQELTIRRVQAQDARATDAIVQALAKADLAATAVGAAILPHLAPIIAAALIARIEKGSPPLNLLLCENQWHAADVLREALRPCLPQPWAAYEPHIGLVETVIGRMVPTPPPSSDPLLLVAEPYQELPVARAGLRGPAPALPGLIAAENFEAYEARKLFLHNAGHAALAYLGHRRGHDFIWQCVADPEVNSVCHDALLEASAALMAEYDFTSTSLRSFCDDLMHRFANKALGDTVARVAADPQRKLRPDDRLLGATALCAKHGIASPALEQVIVAAREYKEPRPASPSERGGVRSERGGARETFTFYPSPCSEA